MKFQIKMKFPEFDLDRFTKAMDDAVETQMRQAAREFLRAAIPRVPVFTGTARGTLQPLGRFLKVAVPISPVAVRKGQGPGVGASNSTFDFTNENHHFSFSTSTKVQHFIINNFYKVPDPPFHLKEKTPWGAYEAGRDAFKAYLTTTMKERLPKIKDYMKYTTRVSK